MGRGGGHSARVVAGRYERQRARNGVRGSTNGPCRIKEVVTHLDHPLPAAWSPFLTRREWRSLCLGLSADHRADVLGLLRRMDPVLRERFVGHLLDQVRRADGPPVPCALERALRERLLEGARR